ncbi:MAG: nucleotidyl transferase AbiEii/AbiGii toxin family protein, partial [Bacillota bacterium]|nr:nucleotidyl transferase AbiEii/AbiGii toxin family protein [Bacillota bacterium]
MGIEQSILQRLKNKSKSKRISFQLALQLFCQEEFLRRLSLSEYREKLILKGGLFIFSYTGFDGRPTMDIDFLGKELSNNSNDMFEVISRIFSIKTENNYINFKIRRIENITEIKEYHGLRIKIMAKIGNTKTPFDIDIGLGDIVIPDIQNMSYTTQLKEFDSPMIKTYSLESTIAEKLEAICDHLEMTSRLKDYYDIYYLSLNFNFDSKVLLDAIISTFENRNSIVNEEVLNKLTKINENEIIKRRWLA